MKSMATYFHGSSEIQAAADGMQTLYLMNPSNYVPYSDNTHQYHQQPTANMLFLNPTGNSLNHSNLPHAPPPNHHLVGIPLPPPSANMGPTNSDDHSRPSSSSSFHGLVPGGVHYNLWGSMDQNLAAVGNSSGGGDVVSQLGFRRPVMSPNRQALSLSLSPQQASYRSINGENDIHAHAHAQAQAHALSSGDDIRVSGNSPSSVSAVSNGVSGMQSVILGSKYLKATQELLDEVVNVGKGLKSDSVEGANKEKVKVSKESMALTGEGSSGGGESSAKRGAELTTAQRQELQMKKAKLVSMLDEVEQRYRQYHHQMQIVASSFEQAAGFGAAKSYTALALKTISKQFRCLKDAISAQIKATSKGLGEEDCLGVKGEGSRLRYVDHQLRQQRALQQLGMIQHNAWRPQRGLPERAVSVLRAWLFEHFLHPYPKDSDKSMLAKQTGLTRSQVSNWFINARVRLWKPMVEEMYTEEIKEHERNGSKENKSENEHKEQRSNSNVQQESGSLRMDQVKALQSKPETSTNQIASPTEFSNSTISTSPMGGSLQQQTVFNLIGSSDLEGIAQRSPKKPRSNDMQNSPSSILSMDMDMKQGETSREICMKFGGERLNKDGYSLITGTTNHDSGFGQYPMGEIGKFTPRFHGNSVSLTLGLPHCETLSLSGTQQNFLSSQSIQLGRRLELGANEPDFCGINPSTPSHSSTGYEIDIQNRKRFAAQLLPDFVT